MDVILLACGAFNPPTIAHLRMMEMAREHVQLLGYHVRAGYFSPVNDAYTKPDLLPITHRMEMLKLSIEDSHWLEVDEWEATSKEWSPTALALANIARKYPNERVMLVAGSDILGSFNVPGLWAEADLQIICSPQHGLIIIQRGPFEHYSAQLLMNPILYQNQKNIYYVIQPVPCELSSTKIRQLCRLNASVKYLIPLKVEEYIHRHSLYK